MTAVLSGTNGLLQSYDYQVLTTGFSYTFAAGTQVLVINPAGTLATGTITMPAAPADGMTITVESTQQVTALTMSGNGGTVVGPAVQLIPNQPLSWVYRLANTTWYPVFGGAGRATALVSGTAVASTSGTSVDFTSIPSWVKRITVSLVDVGMAAASANTYIRIGTSGTVVSTGYSNNYIQANGSNTFGILTGTTGFIVGFTSAAANTINATAVLTLVGSNTWSYSSNSVENAATRAHISVGSISLGGTLNILSVVLASSTYDAGSINILYE
jgi:hypothetical protein